MLKMFTLVSFLFCLHVSAQANNDTFHGMTASSQFRGFHAGGVPNSYRQPAVAGTTIIMSCEAAFIEGDKGFQFRQGFKHLSWSLMRSQNGSFTFLGGMNSTGSVSMHSDPQKYAIGSTTGSLTIYNVAKGDETEYKCAVSHQENQDSEPDESFVKLDVIEIPAPPTATPSPKPTSLPTTPRGTTPQPPAPTTDKSPLNTTSLPTPSSGTTPQIPGPTREYHGGSNMLSFGAGIGIGVAIGFVVAFVLVALLVYGCYRRKQQGSSGRSNRIEAQREVLVMSNISRAPDEELTYWSQENSTSPQSLELLED